MRYNFILTVSLLCFALTSCVREEMVENVAGAEGTQITISASIRNAPGTKTYMGDEVTSPTNYYPIYWHDNEKIALFSKRSIGVFTLSSVRSDNRDIADFTGDAGDMPIKFEGSDVYPAAYPVDNAFARIDEDGNLHVGSYLPFQQPYRDNTFSDDVFPMAAASANGEDFEFYNLCGVLQIPVKGTEDGQEIRSVYLSGNNGEIVAGGIGMVFDPNTGEPLSDDGDITNGKKIAIYGDEGYTRIIVNFDEPLVLNTSETKYINIAVIPQKFSNGIKVEMMDAKNMGISMVTAGEIDIKRSVLTRLTVLSYVEPEPAQVANSYVYSDAGYYLMPAYAMGNRMDVTLPTQGRKLAADLLWSELIKVDHNTTDKADLVPAVTNIEYIPSEDGLGMLQFRINKDPNTGNPYRGNAAIALYDADTKEVIWSWHVWMSETPHDVITGGATSSGTYSYKLPDGTQVDYAAEATSGKLVIMDRNLGAISANPADGWKTYGLYYQNGRRDPFIGGHWDGDRNTGTQTTFSSPADNLKVRLDEDDPFTVGETDTAPVWYNVELAPDGWNWIGRYQNISTALRFPMTFSAGFNKSNGQWTDYTDADNKSWMDPNVGGGKKGSTSSGGTHGNTGLSDGGHQSYWNRTKTIMDPCPVGYSVLGDKTDVQGAYLNSDTKTYIFAINQEDLTTQLSGKDVKYQSGSSYSDIAFNGHAIYGMMSKFTYNDTPYYTWWPAAGVRAISGYLGGVGYMGMYFHYDHIAATHGGHGSYFDVSNTWAAGKMTNQAGSVRCVREKQFSDLSKYPLK